MSRHSNQHDSETPNKRKPQAGMGIGKIVLLITAAFQLGSKIVDLYLSRRSTKPAEPEQPQPVTPKPADESPEHPTNSL